MKLKLLIPFLAALACYGQAVRVDPIPAFTVASNVPAGANPPILALPGATVAVCADAGCSTPLNTYTNAGAGTGCPSATPLVPAGTASCAGTTDARGNFGFWVTAGVNGWYKITTSSGTYGPYPFSASGSGGGGGGLPSGSGMVKVVSGLGALAVANTDYAPVAAPVFTGNVTFSGLAGSGIQCLNVSNTGVISGTGSACPGSGSGLPSGTGMVKVVSSTGALAVANTDYLPVASPVFSGTISGGAFSGTTLAVSGNITTAITGSTQCLQVNSSGVVSGTGSACGSGGGSGTVSSATIGQLAVYTAATTVGGITAGGDLTFSTPNFTLATVNSNVGACGDTSHWSIPTFDAKGRVTGCTAQAGASLTSSNTYTSASSSQFFQGAGGYVQIVTATNPLIGVYAGTGATASAFYFSAAASAAPSIILQVGTTTYNGVTGTGCSQTVSGLCVANGTGSVTSVATTLPISGGPITSTGTISCPTCLTTAGGWTVTGSATFSGTTAYLSNAGETLLGRYTAIQALYQDEVALLISGYPGGSDDLVDAYPSGISNAVFSVSHIGNVSIGYGPFDSSAPHVTHYGAWNTWGQGLVPVYGEISGSGSGTTSPVSINCGSYSGGSTCGAGIYRVSVYLTDNYASAGAAYGLVSWVDSTGTKSVTFSGGVSGGYNVITAQVPIDINGSASPTFAVSSTQGNWSYVVTLEEII